MRIVCDSCGTKYSISDDKVRGKVFKIRCKKCSHVIVVRGNEDDAAAEGGDQAEDAGGAVWYVVLGGQQDGPHTVEQVRVHLQAGNITPDTFVWREGFGDWLRLADAEGLSQLVAAPPAANGAANGSAMDDLGAFGDNFDDGESTRVVSSSEVDERMGFAAAAAPAPRAAAPRAAASSADGWGAPAAEPAPMAAMGGGGLGGYGAEPAQPSAFGGGRSFDSMVGGSDIPKIGLGNGAGALQSMPAEDDDAGSDDAGAVRHGMVGARNENSVLFSLSSLQAINQKDDDRPKNTEASGLIDIAALSASAAAVANQRADGGPGGASADPFGGGMAGPAIAMPAMMQMGTRRSNTGLIVGIIAAVVLVLGLVTVILVLVLNKPDQSTTIVKEIPVETPANGAAGGSPTIPDGAMAANSAKDDDKADDDNADDDKADDGAEGNDDDKSDDDKGDDKEGAAKKAADKKAAGGGGKAPAGGNAKVDRKPDVSNKRDTPPPKEDKKPAAKGNDSIDSILSDISGGGGAKKTPPKEDKVDKTPTPPPAGKKLSKADVQSTIQRYSSQVGGCSNGQAGERVSGTVMVRFTIQPNGSVGSAQVTSSQFQGKPVAGCITRVVRSMKFPTSGESLTINYPFVIR